MILLLSSDVDYSTSVIVQWLRHFGYRSFLRLSPLDFINNNIEILPDKGLFYINGTRFDFSSVNIAWYRRFGEYIKSTHYKIVEQKIDPSAASLLSLELNNITDYFMSLLPNVEMIGSNLRGNTNKLIEIRKAFLAGLNVPYTVIVSDKERLKQALSRNKSLISKSLYNAREIYFGNDVHSMFTADVTSEYIKKLPDTFFPSLIQKKIEKDYEIRIFYINGSIYCMAIISQDNEKTKLDYRRYDIKKPNRFIPCDIDYDTKEKIKVFMKSMNLNIGSLDFIKGLDGELYFLEVNHMGQFGMVDRPCNYGIHKKIAEYLIQKDKI